MSAVPRLSESDIQLEIERIFSKERRARLTALYGTGDAGTVSARGKQWQIVPTRCELELRARMPAPGEDGPPKVFLVDWTERPLPLDLGCRLAAGRVFRISRGTLLAVQLGARQAEAKLIGTGLADVLLAGDVGGLKKVSGLTLTWQEAYRRFLDAHLGLPLAAAMNAAGVAAWAAGARRCRSGATRARGRPIRPLARRPPRLCRQSKAKGPRHKAPQPLNRKPKPSRTVKRRRAD